MNLSAKISAKLFFLKFAGSLSNLRRKLSAQKFLPRRFRLPKRRSFSAKLTTLFPRLNFLRFLEEL